MFEHMYFFLSALKFTVAILTPVLHYFLIILLQARGINYLHCCREMVAWRFELRCKIIAAAYGLSSFLFERIICLRSPAPVNISTPHFIRAIPVEYICIESLKILIPSNDRNKTKTI